MSRTSLRRRVRSLLVSPSWHRLAPPGLRHSATAAVSLAETSAWLADIGPMPMFEQREALYAAVLDGAVTEPVDYLEFGVSTGESIRWWSTAFVHADTRLVGFDTFEGLPEDWGVNAAGTYTAEGRLPQLGDDRAEFEVGLFQDTLPGWLRTNRLERRTVVHLDADLYSSTLFVLSSLAPQLRVGDVLVFDEFGSIRNAGHEFRAFADFTTAYQWTYEPVGATTAFKQVALRVAAGPTR